MAEAQDRAERPEGFDQASCSEKQGAEEQKEPSSRSSDEHGYDRSPRGHVVINQGEVGQQFIGTNFHFDSYKNIEKQKERKSAPEVRRSVRGGESAPQAGSSDGNRVSAPPVVFVSYSRNDSKWLEKLQKHLTPLHRAGIIDLQDDTKNDMGVQWREVLRASLENVQIAITLVSANFFASDFIVRYELPALLERARAGKTQIIPLIISHSLFEFSELEAFQAANDPRKPLEELSLGEQDRIFMMVARTIRQRLMSEASDN